MQWVENGLLILQNAFPYFYLNLLKVPLVTKDSWSFSKPNYPCAIGHLTENSNFKILIKIGQGLMWYILTGRYHLFGKLQSSDPNESGIWISCMFFFYLIGRSPVCLPNAFRNWHAWILLKCSKWMPFSLFIYS